MLRQFQRISSMWLLAAASCLFGTAASAEDPADQTIDAFLQHVQGLQGISDEKKDQVHKRVAQLRADPYTQSESITGGLTELYPEYDRAMLATHGEDLDQAITLLQPLADSGDNFLAADAAFYLARTLMNAERYELALPLLKKVGGQLSEYSLHAGSALYFLGVAHAGMLDNASAVDAFTEFLETYPDAPERLQVAAWRQVQQLQTIREGQLDDVHQRMDYSRRRLHLEQTGEKTQEEQDRIIKMLAQLIKDQEKKECSNCNGGQNTQQQQESQAQGQQQAQNQGKSDTGGASNNPAGVVRRTFDDGPASPWSRLRDRSRDPANSAIKEKLPARYRDVVQRYFDRNSGSDKSDQ